MASVPDSTETGHFLLASLQHYCHYNLLQSTDPVLLQIKKHTDGNEEYNSIAIAKQ
jgi:hypothetical protein